MEYSISVPWCGRVRALRNQPGGGLASSVVYQPASPHVYESGGLTTVRFLAPASKRGAANTRWDAVRVIVPPTDRPRAVQPFDACTLAQVQGKALESA